jgi:hypothetical protein
MSFLSTNLIPSAYDLFSGVPVRHDLSPADKAFKHQYGDWQIQSMTVIRTPIQKYVSKALNWLSAGAYEDAVAKYGYDNLFHLALIGTSTDNINTIQWLTEERGVVSLRQFKPSDVGPQTQQMQVPLTNDLSLTLDSMFADTILAIGGDKFYEYSIYSNNCQDYVIALLGATHLLTPELNSFIKQPIQGIAQSLDSKNPLTTHITNAVTRTHAKLRNIFGLGLQLH